MSYLVVMIVDDPDQCPAILEAWDALGVSGVTILESTGWGRMRKAAWLDDMPLIPHLQNFLATREVHHRTLLSVVETEQVAEDMALAAQKITGDLDAPNTGFLFILPVLKAYGLCRE